MSTKKYKANTGVSINVVLPNKKNMHVSFTSLSDGSSVYSTDNEDVQKAIENHYNFGRLFRFAGYIENNPNVKLTDTATVGKNEPRVVKVSDIADAKEYLADKLGISRSSLRNVEAIKTQAKAHDIVFDGI